MSEKFPVPESLEANGAALWERIVEDYDLRPDELMTLEDACVATDLIAILTKEWNALGRPYESKGSMNQPQEHYLISAIDKQRKSRNALWRQLKLPDSDGNAGESNQHRSAAQSKWAKRA